MITAGKKEHIIKSVIDYFKEKGIGQVDLQSLQNNLNTLDENNLLPIIERRTNGVFFDGILYEDFLKFQEEVDGMYGEYKFRQKTNEQKVLQKNEPTEFVPGKISVFPINNDNDAIKYGVNTDWCISRPGSGMCENYRSTYDSTFYYVQDGTRKSYDPLSRVIVDMRKDGVVSLTDKNNTTGTVAKFGQDWKKYFLYLESKGVNTSQFVNKPLTQEEIEEKNLISEKIDELDKFNKLPFEYKFKYIGRGHLLSTEQLMSILNLQSVKSTYAKDTLINHYLNTGRCLPPIQKVILFENNEGLKKTYIRRREIEIDEIHEHYKDDDGEVDYDRLVEFANFYNDDEVHNKDNLYKDPLKFEDILVKNVEEFYFLLNKGVSLDQFNWIEISKMPNLPEDFIRKFKDEVYWILIAQYQVLSEDFIEDSKEDFKDSYVWSQISLYQKLSEDFIRKFKDKVNWTFIF